jgi:hypothetical protein
VADVPDCLSLSRHRDLVGRGWRPWVRRVLLGLLLAVLGAGLANLFGQRPGSSSAAAPAAELKVYAPSRVRGGLFYEARFTIDARRELKKATIVLDSGWLEGMTINTVEPGPLGEASRDGKLVLELGHVPAGETYLLFLQIQVNPTNVGHRSQDVELFDGPTRLLTVDRTITIFP